MRILKRGIERDNSGFVNIQPDKPEDMYYLYNLINQGDFVTASTVRNVVKESATGATTKNRTRTRVKLEVVKVEFDAEQCSLRVNGKNVAENEFIKMGQHHTVELELTQPFTLEKSEWDVVHKQILEESTAINADILCIVMEEGLAHICMVGSTMTVTKARVEKKFPRKNDQRYEEAKIKFFKQIYDNLIRFVDFSLIKVVLVGSAGFWKDEFITYALEQSIKLGHVLHKHRSSIIARHTTSGHFSAVTELFSGEASGELAVLLRDVKALGDIKALEEFHNMLNNDVNRACYGVKEVEDADNQLAVLSLLISDSLMQSSDFVSRKRYISLVESVKSHGGEVHILSSLHSSGVQLNNYTGIAATLRFPLSFEWEENVSTGINAKESVEVAAPITNQELDDVFGFI